MGIPGPPFDVKRQHAIKEQVSLTFAYRFRFPVCLDEYGQLLQVLPGEIPGSFRGSGVQPKLLLKPAVGLLAVR